MTVLVIIYFLGISAISIVSIMATLFVEDGAEWEEYLKEQRQERLWNHAQQL